MSIQLPPNEHLERSLEFIRTQEAQMRRALQSPQGRLLVAIKHASQMLGELRTSALPPKPYYELYNACFDALTLLQGYMREAHRNHHLADVYEIVEYTGNVLPRLYLMITVGTAYLGSGDAPNQEVLKDMLEMARGVQHPLRGIFLRYYLGQRTRDFLATSRADIHFSIQFTLTNFVEMNKLWVRYQHQGHSREFVKRMEERRQLQTAVGSNIYRLAQLDNIDLPAFRELVLPAVLDQVVQCHDPLAQEYLLDVLIQAFPAEYHIDTLPQYFDCVASLSPQTSKRAVLIASLNRVIEHAESSKDERATSESLKKLADSKELGDKESGDKVGEEKQNKPMDEHTGSQEHEETTEELESEELAAQPVRDDALKGPGDANAEGAAKEDSREGYSEGEENSGRKTVALDDVSETITERDVAIEDTVGQADHESAKRDVPSQQDDKNTRRESFDSTKDPVASVSEQTAQMQVTEPLKRDTLPAPSELFVDALDRYWHLIQQLEVSSADRAALTQKLIALLELVDDDNVNLQVLISYVTKAEIQPSSDFEQLILTLFDSNFPLSEILVLLKRFPQLLASQSKETRHAVATKVLDNLVAAGALISEVEQAKQIFVLFGILLKSGDLDVSKVTQLLHLLQGPDSFTTLELLQLAYRSLRDGGPGVIKKTFGVLVNTTLLLLREDAPASLVGQALRFVNKTCHDLTTIGDAPLSSYRLYLLAAGAADYVGAEEAAYELFAEALSTYEEHISDSRQQIAALAIAIRALQRATVFSADNFEPLAQRCQQCCQRLLKKQDQCRMLLLVSSLFWDNEHSQAQKVSELLTKAMRIADAIMDTKTSFELFLDVLDSNLYFLGADVPTVTIESVNSLLGLIRENFETSKSDDNDAFRKLWSRLHRTTAFVRSQETEITQYQGLQF